MVRGAFFCNLYGKKKKKTNAEMLSHLCLSLFSSVLFHCMFSSSWGCTGSLFFSLLKMPVSTGSVALGCWEQALTNVSTH